MTVISHNLSAMNAQRQLGINTNNKSKSAEKLSSGYKINRAADDAAGLAISEKMRQQIRGLEQGERNIQDGISWIQAGDGALEEVNAMLHRMTELSVYAANGTVSDEDRQMINDEFQHLKNEINRIGATTKFNEETIFITPEVSLGIEGCAEDLNIFNASYDDQTGEVSYGGFLFRENRITWDKVNSNMVYKDAVTGEQCFKEGTYTYTDTNNHTFKIECEEGAKVPKITRIIDVSADTAGIYVDGQLYSWNDFVDENGIPASSGNLHEGCWSLEHEGSTVSYYFFQPTSEIDDMIQAINSNHDAEYTYTWEQEYVGPRAELAVDILNNDKTQISENLVNNLVDGKMTYTLRAGKDASQNENGIWLEDYKGNKISDSFKSWSDLGINSWDNGDDINSTLTYEYTDTEGNRDTYVSFSFQLSDITSVDSVIDGLDGVKITDQNYTSDYEANATVSNAPNIFGFNAKFNINIEFEEELSFDRNFDSAVVTNVSNANVDYNESTETSKLVFKNGSGNDVIVFDSTTDEQRNLLSDDVNTYADYVLLAKQNAILMGKDPDTVQIATPNLTDIVGTNNITTSGYFDTTVTIDNSMTTSDGDNYYTPGILGETYPTAYINFSGLGSSYTLDNLLGAGFNTTCKTCSNHYSVVFVDSITNGETADGKYTYKKTSQGDDNYTLQISLESLKAADVDTGAELTEAIVSITSKAYDFHYTQYASKDDILYIHDNRAQSIGTTAATFDTFPYQAIDITELSFELASDDGDTIKFDYSYNLGDLKDCIDVSMKQDNFGNYVKVTKTDGTEVYELYNSEKHSSVPNTDRYTLETTYTLDGTSYTNLDDLKTAYVKKSIKTMLENTNTQLNANDFSYITFAANENPNTALRSKFNAEVVKEKFPGLIIQCSAAPMDKIEIPRFELHTMDLKLHNANTKTIEDAEATIDRIDTALQRLSEKRATFGAYQNRLEHTYNNNSNTKENTTAAESRIRDTDMANEIINQTKLSILEQVGQAMMAQANQMNQGILALLQ